MATTTTATTISGQVTQLGEGACVGERPNASDSDMGAASPDGALVTCGDAGAPPECLHGAPCSCDDVSSNDGAAICVDGVWDCPLGYTRFQDCLGIPPGPECVDASRTP